MQVAGVERQLDLLAHGHLRGSVQAAHEPCSLRRYHLNEYLRPGVLYGIRYSGDMMGATSRGLRPPMQVVRPDTQRNFAGFASGERMNTFYLEAVAQRIDSEPGAFNSGQIAIEQAYLG
jgi:hypothetical protein